VKYVFLLVGSTAIEFVVVWWFIAREYQKPASVRRFLLWLILIGCLVFSPFFQISTIRRIVAQKELANNIAYGWVILGGLCVLAFMFTMLSKLGKGTSDQAQK
jgi:hypothetical protein